MDARPDPQPEEADLSIDFDEADDCRVIRLPTMSALSYDTAAAEAAASPAHWQALAAAVMSEATFDEIDAALGKDGSHNAKIIELDLWRG